MDPVQTDKEKKVVFLYATDTEAQYPFIEAAKNKGYDVLLMDCELDAHYVNLLEQKIADTRFARVDSDSIDNLIQKEERIRLEMNEADRKDLGDMMKAVLPEGNDYYVEGANLGEDGDPILITQNEFMRRYHDMGKLGGGMNFYGEMPASYNITLNMENPLVAKVVEEAKATVKPLGVLPAEAPKDASEEDRKKAREAREAVINAHRDEVQDFARGSEILRQFTDLALLANGMLKGKALADFIARSRKVVTDAYLQK